MKKRILSILLCLCMVFGLLPTTALAAEYADDDYGTIVRVAETTIWQSNASNTVTYWTCNNNTLTSASAEDNWNVKYDPTGTIPTLTLNGFSYTGAKNGVRSSVALKIVLKGSNTIENTKSVSSDDALYNENHCIFVKDDLTITGTDGAVLTVESQNGNGIMACHPAQAGVERHTESIVIESANITATAGGDVGIVASQSLTIKNSTINSTGKNYGLQGGNFTSDRDSNISISNSTITAKATASNGKAFQSTPTTSGTYQWRSSDTGEWNPNTSAPDFSQTYLELKLGASDVNAQTPTITAEPADATYTRGETAVPLTVSASVTDGGTLSYQWFKGDGITASKIEGAISNTYTPPTDTMGAVEYICVVTNTIQDNGDGGTKTATKQCSAWITVTEDANSEYSISLDTTGTHTFTAATVGYAAQTAKTVTVSNTGNRTTGDLTVTLSGSNADSFTLSKNSITDIAVSGNDTFTIVPKSGLSAGTYTATVTVSGNNSITASFDVSFTVNAASGSAPDTHSHSGGTATCTEKAKCTECGTSYGELADHTYGNATCEAPATCSECRATTGDALGHKDENTDHTCDRGCGKTDMGIHAAASGKHTCEYCGNAVTTCTDFAEVVKPEALKSAADCTNPAVYYKSCVVCGANGTETFTSGEADRHSFTNYVSDGNATCTADGTKTAKCDNCNVTDTLTNTGSKKTHTYENGKCTVCQTVDPDYVPESSSPQTGDNNMLWMWIALLFVSGFGVVTTTLLGKKRFFTK